MKLGAIFKSVATAVGGPGVGAAVAVATNLINQFKGRDEQLPAGATRPEVEAAYDTLPEAAKAEVDEETDSAEASVDVLEDAEESADVAIAEAVGEDDPAESLRATASEWLGSILQSVPKEDK